MYLEGLTSARKTHFVLFSYCVVLLSTSPLHLPGRHASGSGQSITLLAWFSFWEKLMKANSQRAHPWSMAGCWVPSFFFQDKIQASCQSSGLNQHNNIGVMCDLCTVLSWIALNLSLKCFLNRDFKLIKKGGKAGEGKKKIYPCMCHAHLCHWITNIHFKDLNSEENKYVSHSYCQG